MATYVETPVHEHYHEETRSGSNYNALWTIIGLILLALLIFYFGLPLLRSATTVPQVNVPGNIDVNVKTPNAPAPQQ